jgi:hypothetical protein
MHTVPSKGLCVLVEVASAVAADPSDSRMACPMVVECTASPCQLTLPLPVSAPPPWTPAGLFVDVENGSEVLLLAVRRDVGDLSLAHRIYDSMRKTLR